MMSFNTSAFIYKRLDYTNSGGYAIFACGDDGTGNVLISRHDLANNSNFAMTSYSTCSGFAAL